VNAAGVWVIDSKEYRGRVEQVNVGGILRQDMRLKVAGRDRTKLIEGVLWQMNEVATALDRIQPTSQGPTVLGMVCFVGAEWGLFSKAFTFRGVHVVWPLAAVELLGRPGQANHDDVVSVAEALSRAFPSA
jgi:hypothetical protein